MNVIDLYSTAQYLTMLDKSQLKETKRRIKEQYLQNLLAVNRQEKICTGVVDPAIEAYLQDELDKYLDETNFFPGVNEEKSIKERNSSYKEVPGLREAFENVEEKSQDTPSRQSLMFKPKDSRKGSFLDRNSPSKQSMPRMSVKDDKASESVAESSLKEKSNQGSFRFRTRPNLHKSHKLLIGNKSQRALDSEEPSIDPRLVSMTQGSFPRNPHKKKSSLFHFSRKLELEEKELREKEEKQNCNIDDLDGSNSNPGDISLFPNQKPIKHKKQPSEIEAGKNILQSPPPEDFSPQSTSKREDKESSKQAMNTQNGLEGSTFLKPKKTWVSKNLGSYRSIETRNSRYFMEKQTLKETLECEREEHLKTLMERSMPMSQAGKNQLVHRDNSRRNLKVDPQGDQKLSSGPGSKPSLKPSPTLAVEIRARQTFSNMSDSLREKDSRFRDPAHRANKLSPTKLSTALPLSQTPVDPFSVCSPSKTAQRDKALQFLPQRLGSSNLPRRADLRATFSFRASKGSKKGGGKKNRTGRSIAGSESGGKYPPSVGGAGVGIEDDASSLERENFEGGSETTHRRFHSDVVEMKTKMSSFLKTMDFNTLFNGDPMMLKKVHNKLQV